MSVFLHEEQLTRVPFLGNMLKRRFTARIAEARDAAGQSSDPDVTVLIRTRNDGKRLESLLQDIRTQEFGGRVQLVVVDTESKDDTPAIARRHGATVISISQEEFTYPKALNLGFAAAKYSLVLCLVGHSNLASRYTLRVAARYVHQPDFGGAFSFGMLPDDTASTSERWINTIVALRLLTKRAGLSRQRMGLLAGNDSLVNKAAWEKLGGYDERFAAGGEDSELGRQMLANGYKVYWEPALTAFHAHGLSLRNQWGQYQEWRRLSKPHPFEHDKLKRYGRDFS
jgi:GT2 family glycosyltransferase